MKYANLDYHFQVTQIKDIHLRWFRVEPWKRWCHSLLLKITEGSFASPTADEDMGESPAFEVNLDLLHHCKFRQLGLTDQIELSDFNLDFMIVFEITADYDYNQILVQYST